MKNQFLFFISIIACIHSLHSQEFLTVTLSTDAQAKYYFEHPVTHEICGVYMPIDQLEKYATLKDASADLSEHVVAVTVRKTPGTLWVANADRKRYVVESFKLAPDLKKETPTMIVQDPIQPPTTIPRHHQPVSSSPSQKHKRIGEVMDILPTTGELGPLLINWKIKPCPYPTTISLTNKYDWIQSMKANGYHVYITHLGSPAYHLHGIAVYEDFKLEIEKDILAKRPITSEDCKTKKYGNYCFINRFSKDVEIQIEHHRPGYSTRVFARFVLAPGDQKCEYGLKPMSHKIYYYTPTAESHQKQTQIVVVEECFEKVMEIK